MTELTSFLDLPFGTMAALGGGYLGFRTAYVGRDRALPATEVVFRTLVFAAIARGGAYGLSPLGGAIFGVLLAIGMAVIWRRAGREWATSAFKSVGLGISDPYLTAWDSIRCDERLRPVQIIVRRKDGAFYMCDRLSHFASQPTGALIYGDDGSVAFFPTMMMGAGEEVWTPIDPVHEGTAMITYFPVSEISMIEVRH